MSVRSFCFLPLLASAFLGAPAAADHLFVAGADGVVLRADTADGVFAPFTCACAGPIRALAADDERLYAADEFNQLLIFDVDDGALQSVFIMCLGQINSLTTANGWVFAGTEAGYVVGFDPVLGGIQTARQAPAGVNALIAHQGFLYAATSDGAIYRASAAGEDEFEYFSCFCFFNIQDMVMASGDLLIGDSFGTVARVSVATGEVLGAFSVGVPLNSMAIQGHALLFYYGSGPIPMVDVLTGALLSSGFTSPVDVQVMLLRRVPPPAKTRFTKDFPQKR